MSDFHGQEQLNLLVLKAVYVTLDGSGVTRE